MNTQTPVTAGQPAVRCGHHPVHRRHRSMGPEQLANVKQARCPSRIGSPGNGEQGPGDQQPSTEGHRIP